MNLDNLLQEYLTNNTLMQLATLGEDGQPWLCSVYFVHDEDDNLYWTSARSKRRHSREIKGDELKNKHYKSQVLPQKYHLMMLSG